MSDLLENLPAEVSIYEVSPRDGLQNEAVSVATVHKARLVEALMQSGLRRIELTAFVVPRLVPQLADAEDLVRIVQPAEGVVFSALVPNLRGLQRLLDAGLPEVKVYINASESHNQRNSHCDIAASLAMLAELVPQALAHGRRVRGYVSDAWGCPYEGRVPPGQVIRLAERLLEMGCYEVVLADVIGVATPSTTGALLGEVLKQVPADKLGLHMHDTRGMALSNVLVALEHDIRAYDASVAGLGSCPFAPGAAGNLATEDLIYMLENIGVRTGVNAEKLWQAGRTAETLVSRELSGRVHKAGLQSLRK